MKNWEGNNFLKIHSNKYLTNQNFLIFVSYIMNTKISRQNNDYSSSRKGCFTSVIECEQVKLMST